MSLETKNFIKIPIYMRVDVYADKEDGYHPSYSQHLKFFLFLKEHLHFEREAYYELLIALECFFKDLICNIRFRLFGNQKEIVPEKLGKALLGTSFGHDIFAMTSVLFNMFDELKDDEDFVLFKSKIPRGETWIQDRYSHPENYSRVDFKEKYSELFDTFEKFSAKRFSSYL